MGQLSWFKVKLVVKNQRWEGKQKNKDVNMKMELYVFSI